MGNSIPLIQNQLNSLRLLTAQRRLYGHAKTAAGIQVALVVILPAALTVFVQFVQEWKLAAATIGLSIAIIDFAILNAVKSHYRRRAAAIQELFDCEVLQLDWPALKVSKPDPEDVQSLASGADSSGLADWYPSAVGRLPIHVARVICQRANCRWDSALRRRFRGALFLFGALIMATIVLAAIVKQLTMDVFVLSMLAPVSPIVFWLIREAREHGEAADRAERLKNFGTDLWNLLLSGSMPEEEVVRKSTLLQSEIFEHRQRSPLVFDWFYKLLRRQFDAGMHTSAEEMVESAAGQSSFTP